MIPGPFNSFSFVHCFSCFRVYSLQCWLLCSGSYWVRIPCTCTLLDHRGSCYLSVQRGQGRILWSSGRSLSWLYCHRFVSLLRFLCHFRLHTPWLALGAIHASNQANELAHIAFRHYFYFIFRFLLFSSSIYFLDCIASVNILALKKGTQDVFPDPNLWGSVDLFCIGGWRYCAWKLGGWADRNAAE
ncbi:hypothetical protein VTI74DRAFT_4090 [Chaetomium olivicolor]